MDSSSVLEKTRHLEGYLNFNYLDAAFIVGAIFTYAIDLGFGESIQSIMSYYTVLQDISFVEAIGYFRKA